MRAPTPMWKIYLLALIIFLFVDLGVSAFIFYVIQYEFPLLVNMVIGAIFVLPCIWASRTILES